jgi:1,4-alpha-glucan branching enzyme
MERGRRRKDLSVALSAALLIAQQGLFIAEVRAETVASPTTGVASDIGTGAAVGASRVSAVSLGDLSLQSQLGSVGLKGALAAPTQVPTLAAPPVLPTLSPSAMAVVPAAPAVVPDASPISPARDGGAPAADPLQLADAASVLPAQNQAAAVSARAVLREGVGRIAHAQASGSTPQPVLDELFTGGKNAAEAAVPAARPSPDQLRGASRLAALQTPPAMREYLGLGSRYVQGEAGPIDFKLRAPKVTEMWVEVMPRGAAKPAAALDTVDLAFLKSHTSDAQPAADRNEGYASRIVKMQKTADGVFRTRLDGVPEGSVYRYLLNTPAGLLKRPDIMSNQMAFGVDGGWSKSVVQDKFRWSAFDATVWRDPRATPPERILSSAADPEGKHVKPVVAEIDLSDYGGFANPRLFQAIAQLKEAGVNTIHIMPVEDFYGAFTWGYEGVQPAAPATAYGTPEQFKALIDFIHQQRMNAVLDVVFNHRGPFFGYLNDYFQASEPSGKQTPWGNALNYDGAGSEAMREVVIATLFKWAHDYHVDGFRFDMTKYMDSDSMLKEIAIQLRRYPETRGLVLIAEDSRNSQRVTAPLAASEYETQAGADAALREARAGRGLNTLGFDYEWYFDKIHVLLASLVTQRTEGGFEPSLANLEQVLARGPLWTEQGVAAPISRQMSGVTHDEVGNNGGTREVAKALISILNLFERAKGDGKKGDQASFDLIKGYIAQLKKDAGEATPQSARNLAIWDPAVQLQKGYISDVRAAVGLAEFARAFAVAKKRYFQSLVTNIVASSDAKLALDRPGQLGPWRFKAQWPDEELRRRVSADKGYDVSTEGYWSSLPDQPDYTLPSFQEQALRVYHDAAELWRRNPALNGGQTTRTYRYEPHTLQLVRRDAQGNEFLILINRSDTDFPSFNLSQVPAGDWERVFTTDAKGYGGQDVTGAVRSLRAGADEKSVVSLPGTSVVVFKKKAP